MTKKILISSPTADIKSYCRERWMRNVLNFTYDKDFCDIHIVDNSESHEYFNQIKRDYKGKVTVERVSPKQYPTFKETLAASHDRCRKKAIAGKYDYLLHLESDVFPPLNIIERLLDAKKPIVGGLYHIEVGEKSKLMIQEIEQFGQAHRESYNFDETDLSFVDGTVKKVFSCGLGCILIHKSILEQTVFRSEGDIVHPVSIFFADLNQKGIPVHVDTSIYCEHDNKELRRL